MKNKAEQMRQYRTYKHILSIIKDNDAISLCFSFNDATLKKTNKKTRLLYIKRYLNDFASDYVLNCDYGAKKKREHYHAIATPKYKIFLLDAYKYGNIQATKIHDNKRYQNINKNNEEIAKRFYNHATKETTQQSRIIFARKNNQSESKYIKDIDAFLNDKENNTKELKEEQIKAQKRIIEDKTEEHQKEPIRYPQAFYFIYNNKMIFEPKNISDNEIIYVASKYDILTHQLEQRTIIYNRQSAIYKAFIEKKSNSNIVFIDTTI